MCIIAICDGRALTRSEFKNCWDANDHGAGFSWYDAAGINYKKGFMDEKKAWRAYNQMKDNLPHIAHFRLTSAGSKTPELTHPFTCADLSPIELTHAGADSVLFHNGTIRAWRDWQKAYVCSRRACFMAGSGQKAKTSKSLFQMMDLKKRRGRPGVTRNAIRTTNLNLPATIPRKGGDITVTFNHFWE